MKKLKIAGILLILFLSIMFIFNINSVSAIGEKILNIQSIRPYNDNNGDGEIDDVFGIMKINSLNSVYEKIYKIYDVNDAQEYNEAMYCLRGGLGFGTGETSVGNSVTYTNQGNMKTEANAIIAKYNQNTGITIDNNNYNAILWILDNMYLPKNVDHENMKAKLLQNAQITNSQLTDDDIEVVQQLALWYFSNFDTNGQSLSYSFNKELVEISNILRMNYNITSGVDELSDNSNYETRRMQINTLYNYFINTAIAQAESYETENNREKEIIEPIIAFGNTNPQVTTKNVQNLVEYYVAGPFNITAIGNIDYNFDYSINTQTVGQTISIDNRTKMAFICDAEGNSTYNKDIKDMINQGDFYIAINKIIYSNITEIKLNLTYDYSYYTTIPTLWTATNQDQPVVMVEKILHEGGNTLTKNSVNIEGNFKLKIIKTDENNNNLRGASFSVAKKIGNVSSNETLTNNNDGSFITGDIDITQINQEFIFDITETLAPNGYSGVTDTIKLKVVTGLNQAGTEYEAKSVQLVDNRGIEVTITGVTVSLANGVITVTVQNNPLESAYSLRIIKEDKDGNTITEGTATFKINDEEKQTVNGVANLGTYEISTTGTDIYEIEETNAPVGYNAILNSLTITVTKEFTTNGYEVAGVRFTDAGTYTISTDGKTIKDGEDIIAELDNISGTISIKVRNSSILDLSLRKFITKVNDTELVGDERRTPKVYTENLANGSSTTAKYTHSKEPVMVKKGDIVTYKIRVYNESDINGYVTEITDYLPEGLGLLLQHKTNSKWHLPDDVETISLVGENGVYLDESKLRDNIELEDFDGITTLDDVMVVTGATDNNGKVQALPITITDLDDELIKAYNQNTTEDDIDEDELWQKSEDGTDGLYYQEVEVACIVLKENTYTGTLRNIAEISKAKDEYNNQIINEGDDRDSIPDNVDIDNYVAPTDNSSYQEDDDDYEPLILRYFDLALRKFITNIEGKDVTTRIPEITIDNEGNIRYVHDKTPLEVSNNDIVTYTLRIYNEGTMNGYAEEVKDDIPEGLEFLPNDTINKDYMWKMYYKDESGNLVETEDANEATVIKTPYLSKANGIKEGQVGNQNTIRAFDRTQMDEPEYKEVKVAFRVVEKSIPTENTKRIIINTAEISKDSDYDEDSIPDNDILEEDDIDKEYIYVRYFDLSLLKWVNKTIVTVGDTTTTTETGYNGLEDPEPIVKVELEKKKLKNTTVKFGYTIQITNEGEIAGYATEITDYIPEGLKFVKEDNPAWETDGEEKITTRALETTLLKPEESATVDVIFTWINDTENMGLKTNIAEISEDYNDRDAGDIDSTPDNRIPDEDDEDVALVMLAVKTGANTPYIGLALLVLTIISSGIFLIKKYVINE